MRDAHFSKLNLPIARMLGVLHRRWKPALLVTVLIAILVATIVPVRTVQALLVDTGIAADGGLSMDANRIAAKSGPDIFVYDIPSGLSTGPFPAPGFAFTIPMLYGDKIVLAGGPGILAATSIFYCVLPAAAAIAPCAGWIMIVAGTPTLAFLAANGFPVFNRNLVVWPIALGFSYYQFTTGAVTAIALPVQPTGFSTNGAIIAFTSGGTLHYLDTTSCGGPCVAADVIDTFLPSASGTAISQNIIAFNEPGPPVLVRYYNVLTGVPSAAGAGPLGTVTNFYAPAVWADRIVFSVSETDLGFDCNGSGVIAAGQSCMRYWNIQPPGAFAGVPAPLLVPAAAPPINGIVAIYDKYIAFVSQAGSLQYVQVPMVGDVDQNGVVNILDAALLAFCFDQNLKNTPPPAGC